MRVTVYHQNQLAFVSRQNNQGDYMYLEYREKHGDTWLCKTGQVMPMWNMSDRHIDNSLALLKRNNQTYTAAYKGLIEQKRQRS